MKTLNFWLLLTMALVVAEAQDFVCKKGKQKKGKTIKIGNGDSYSFKTQAGATYGPNTKCAVTYKRKQASCPMIMFTCSEFNIRNNQASCKSADKMSIKAGNMKKSYCQQVGPDVATSAIKLKVSFISNRKSHASGALCTVSCYIEPTTAAPTEPTTTTESETTTTTGEEPVSITTETTTTGAGTTTSFDTREKYLMYSWARMWSGECNQDELEIFDESSDCFTHPWDTPAKRSKLWCTCNRPGHEIGTLLLYGIAQTTRDAMAYGDLGCDLESITYVRETLAEGHATVNGLQIYALLSEGGVDVPEKALVPSLVWYNQNCAQNQAEKLDGVAVNNEDFDKWGGEEEKVAYLTNLAELAANAGSELRTHYSVGWHWFEAGDVTFNGETKNVLQHMIDLFDSTDMQTAYIMGRIMVDRLQKGFDGDASSAPVLDGLNSWSYSQSQGKMLFATLYLSRIESLGACPTTFFPRPECAGSMGWDVVAYQTEQKMWEEVDAAKSLLAGFTPSLHFYRGVYSCGGHPDWPEYYC